MDPKRNPMSTTSLDANFWNNRYQNKETGWDIGYANPALLEYITSTVNPDAKILIPGLGNGYELESIWKMGYKNVFGSDLSELAKENFLKRVPDYPEDQYMVGNFFDLEGQYDVVLEQTFFCALNPSLRKDYVLKMSEVIKHQGSLAGVLFNFKKPDGPPFGGSEAEYRSLFKPYFDIRVMEECRNSIPQRQGNEFFIELIKNI
jgi:hypothetical protein